MNKDIVYNDYFRIHLLALKAKSNEREKNLLLLNFINFLSQYSDLYDSKINISNNSLLKFIKFFDKNFSLGNLKYKLLNNSNIKEIKAFKNFKASIYSLTKEDFNQEIILSFLVMINRYSDNAPSFHTYIDKNFHFVLLERLKMHFKNISIDGCIMEYKEEYNLSEEIYLMEEEKLITMLSTTIKGTSISIFDDEFINIKWIMNCDFNSKFYELSNIERHIIYLKYMLNKTDSEIADSFGVCRATINRIKNKIKKKLREVQ